MSSAIDVPGASDVAEIIRRRHSERVVFDPHHRPPDNHIRAILEAARWAPTAHNMQNFEIVVDDEETLAEIGLVQSGVSEEFVRENYSQLSFSEEELIQKGTGVLATMFPPSWQKPDARVEEITDFEHGFLDEIMRSCPVVMIVVCDTRRRAPASEGDFLGIMSLGCVMENMWLLAESLGIGMQIMSVFGGPRVEVDLRRILAVPDHLRIAFACRLGYPADVVGTPPLHCEHSVFDEQGGVEFVHHKGTNGPVVACRRLVSS
jgi:nitroreductase